MDNLNKKVYPERNRRVFVAMSGGVDSSVAALLLKNRGYDVTGVFMRCYNVDGCAERDAEDARRVAEKLEIPFYVWDFEEKYKRRVVDYMVQGYRKGITPNPDVMCNKEIKFGLFLEKAISVGADYMATGHYVKLESRIKNLEFSSDENGGDSLSPISYILYSARDSAKDQSYFLWTLTQGQLKHCLFPIGDYLKPEVRRMAREAGLPTADKKDSQGICFLGKVTLVDFLKDYIPKKRGEVVSVSGKKLGEHDGAHFYTIGQRHIGLSSRKSQSSDGEPVYVVAKDVRANTVVVAEGSENPALYGKEFRLADVNFIDPKHSNILWNVGMFGMKILARVRYRQPLAQAELKIVRQGRIRLGRKNLKLKIIFDKPQKFVAPGQSAVFYVRNGFASVEATADREMLGGGVIL